MNAFGLSTMTPEACGHLFHFSSMTVAGHDHGLSEAYLGIMARCPYHSQRLLNRCSCGRTRQHQECPLRDSLSYLGR